MKTHLAILDFDGTLCETHEAITYCMRRTFRDHGTEEPDAESVMATIRHGIGLAETFRVLLGADADNVRIDDWVARYRKHYNGDQGAKKTRLFPGTLKTLKLLADNGCALAVVSNKGELAVRNALDRFELAPLMDIVVCDRPGVPRKPHPDCYNRIIAPAFPDIPPRDTFVVGDTAVDIRFARNIGARSAWASYGYGNRAQCLELSPDVILEDIGELDALVRQPA